MPTEIEQEPWYSRWHEATDRVVAAREARGRAKDGTPERVSTSAEYETALAAYRVIARQIA